MRKPAFCICENKDADQLHSNENKDADQRLCFRFMDSAIPKFHWEPLAIFCWRTAGFVSQRGSNYVALIVYKIAFVRAVEMQCLLFYNNQE